MGEEKWTDIPVSAIGESYGRFRLIYPGSEVTVIESMRQFGQILPVVVVKGLEPSCYEMIDGFKRLRASRKLGLKTIQAKVLSLEAPPLKAAILQLNWKARSIREVEEALIVQSLHREDKLSQVEIGLLLRRHKSWVSRRIALVEKLSDEVLSNLKLGLISAGHGRQLTRLPRGNQDRALATILKHRLCCREAEKLVAMLCERPDGSMRPSCIFPSKSSMSAHRLALPDKLKRSMSPLWPSNFGTLKRPARGSWAPSVSVTSIR